MKLHDKQKIEVNKNPQTKSNSEEKIEKKIQKYEYKIWRKIERERERGLQEPEDVVIEWQRVRFVVVVYGLFVLRKEWLA